MKDNNNQEKNNQELLILELERLCDQYRHLYRGVRINLREAMPDVYKSLRLYDEASKKLKEDIIMVTSFPLAMSIGLFVMTMMEYGYITNMLINFTLGLFAASLVAYATGAIFSKEFRKDIKKAIDAFKHVKEYKMAKEKAKQYEEETIPERKRELDETNDLLIQQLELIKRTTNLIASDEKCCDEYGECNFGLLYDILDKYLPKQPVEPTKTISKVKNLSDTQANFKVKRLVKVKE